MANQKNRNRHDVNPAEVESRIVNFLTGVASKLAGAKPLAVGGDDLTNDQLTAKLQSSQSTFTAADEAHVALSKAVKARDEALAGVLAFLDALEVALRNRFGDSSPDLVSFGIAPKKPRRTLTPEQRLAKAQKSRAARARLREARAQASSPRPPAPPQK